MSETQLDRIEQRLEQLDRLERKFDQFVDYVVARFDVLQSNHEALRAEMRERFENVDTRLRALERGQQELRSAVGENTTSIIDLREECSSAFAWLTTDSVA